MKTSVIEKIRLRSASGKIKGPFTREEINILIRKNKIAGDEDIFLESEGRWKAIASDTDFFDVIQEVQFGLRPETRITPGDRESWSETNDKNSSKKSISDATERLPSTKVLEPIEKTSATGPGVDRRNVWNDLAEAPQQSKSKSIEKQAPNENAQVHGSLAPEAMVPPKETESAKDSIIRGFDELEEKEKRSKSTILRPLLLVIAIGVGAALFLNKEKNQIANFDVSQISYSFDLKKAYFRPLVLRLRLLTPVTLPEAELVNDLDQIKYLAIDFHSLILNWDEKQKDFEKHLSKASFWFERAWTLRILSDIIAVSDLEKSKQFLFGSQLILKELDKKGAYPEAYKKLFSALEFMIEGKLQEALTKAKESETTPGKYFSREVSYWASFDPSIKIETAILEDGLSIDAPLRFQLEENLRKVASATSYDPDFMKSLEALLIGDSHSLLAWFLLARYYSPGFKSSPQVANRYYVTGISQLSLFPRILQGLFWRGYGNFVSQVTPGEEKKYFKTADLIDSGLYESSNEGVDLSDPSLRFKALLETYRVAFEKNEMNPIEFASFEVLSESSSNPKEALILVMISPLLEKNWTLAEGRLRLLEKTFPFESEVKVLRVWYEAERFRFEKAQEVLENDFQNLSGASGQELLKAEGIFLILGRDYDVGIEKLKNYVSTNGQDALAYYFLARATKENESYTDCVRFSNFAQLNSAGPLKFRSLIMNYQCRVRASLGVDQAIKDFEELVERFPETASTREEYIRTLLDADRSQDAMKIAEKQVIERPNNIAFKILLGEVFEKRGQNNEALVMYNEARKIDSASAKAAVHIGDLFFKEKRYSEAAENYVAAGAQDLEFPELFLKAARAYKKANKMKEAQEMYFKEVELRPAVLETFLEASEFFLEINSPASVPELFRRFNENFRSDPRVLTRLAQAHYALGDQAQARTNSELAIRQNPREAEPYRILGNIFEAQGQYPLAKTNFEKYLVLIPQAPDADMLKKRLALPPYSY